jgi:phi13 family phage major tail protein
MARIGLKYPVYAIYTEANGDFTLSAGAVAGKAIKVDVSINIAESVLYADDGVAESVKEFTDGTLTFNADELSNVVKKAWLGRTEETVIWGTVPDDHTVTVLKGTDTDTKAFFAFGFIVSKIIANVRKYRAIIYPKVQFSDPAESAETKGQNITFQTPIINGRIFRAIDGQWVREVEVATLAEAQAWLAYEMSIT